MRSIIIGTAGHIDHGKTTLVRALTGVDADRLPEEKRRGITIDLGFAELNLGDVRVGFVDVPGHERFVKNMLAGAHGIDAVALVVAADEGVMPQTREHFDITRLLETKSGLVVITKTDAVDEELLELVRAEIEELTKNSFLDGAPIVPVSARTGAGIEELKKTLRDVAKKIPARSSKTVTRLPIDRAFTMRGFGAVVTGALVAGEIAEGDELEILPQGFRARVRGVQTHGRAVPKAFAGQRTAVNLGGVETSQLERGMTLAPVSRLQPTQIVDALVEVLPDAPRAIRSRQRVRVHIGAAEVLARAQVLEDAGEIPPGARGFAQLRFESPVVAILDDRFIIRSYSPSRTIAGGRALDALASKHRKRTSHAADGKTKLTSGRALARERLAAILEGDAAARARVYVEMAGERGMKRYELAARTGWRDEVLSAAFAASAKRGEIVEAESVLVSRASFENLTRRALEAIRAHHEREPLARGILRETLREQIFSHAAPEIFRHVLATAEANGAIISERDTVRLASHAVELSPEDAALRSRLEEIFTQAGLEALTIDEALSRAVSAPQEKTKARKILQTLIDSGALLRITNEMLCHRRALEDLTAKLRDYAARETSAQRLIDVAQFKDLAGVSRKYAIPLLEHLDRTRITRRAGDKRLIL